MASIQELGIIHNDLKSANVLLEQVEISPRQFILRGFFIFLSFILCLKNYKFIITTIIKGLYVILD